MVSPRIREVADDKEMARVIDDFMTQGYTVKESGERSALLKKKSWGSGAGIIVSIVLAAILTVFTLGISWLIPIVYAIYAHYAAPEVLIRLPME
jgi:uncharacterized membrane protein YjgN (DUF898 family)